MFTGIIEEIGTIHAVTERPQGVELAVRGDTVATHLVRGESISVDGVCLTVTAFQGNVVQFDVMRETLRCTTLGERRPGDPVNLERALRADSRLGGHFVTGHVDAVSCIIAKDRADNAVTYTFSLPGHLQPYLVPKGSVALDGISLTVGAVHPGQFSVHLIPHTLQSTTLGGKDLNDTVNLETDLLAKYVRAGRAAEETGSEKPC